MHVVSIMAHEERIRAALVRIGWELHATWRLETLLALGGTAAIYEATRRDGHRAAIKVLHPPLIACDRVRAQFLQEVELTCAAHHPGVVTIHGSGEAPDGALFLVMDLLEGESLGGVWRRRAGLLATDKLLAIVDRVLYVLAAVHKRRIVHRDIKPENVFLTRGGEVILIDFGFAMRLDQIQKEGERAELAQAAGAETFSGWMMGTPGFVAPEQASGYTHEVDVRTDLWAVGALLFTLLSGVRLHPAKTTYQRFFAASSEAAPSLADVLEDAPPLLIELVDRALAFHKEDRWADARTMQHALHRAKSSMKRSGVEAMTQTRAAVDARPRGERRDRRSLSPASAYPW